MEMQKMITSEREIQLNFESWYRRHYRLPPDANVDYRVANPQWFAYLSAWRKAEPESVEAPKFFGDQP